MIRVYQADLAAMADEAAGMTRIHLYGFYLDGFYLDDFYLE